MKYREMHHLNMRMKVELPVVEPEDTQAQMNPLRQSPCRLLTKSSPTIHHRSSHCSEHTGSYSQLCQIAPIVMKNDSRLSRDMGIDLKKPLEPKRMQQLKGKGNPQAEGSENPSLLKRMGLEDQLLMVCLGLPFRMPTNSF